MLNIFGLCRHMDLHTHANIIEKACHDTIENPVYRTKDLGGEAKCSEFTNAICEKVVEASD